jgi:hypothetical protein
MRELALSARTQAIFDRIKSYAWTLNVYGLSSSRTELECPRLHGHSDCGV